MSYIYICEQGTNIGYTSGRLTIDYKDGMKKSLPIEPIEAIEIFGNSQISSQCMKNCLIRGIDISFYSSNGSYFGKLSSTNHVNTSRQRQQARLYENMDFRIRLARRIIKAKVSIQVVILRRYSKNSNADIDDKIKQIKIIERKIETADAIDILMGYEGLAARVYFSALDMLIDKDFHFTGRSKRPPKDPFNSMISLGYSILLNEIYGKLQAKGLNPYFGFVHSDREKHPTLASDMMEEWRAVIVDTTVMSMINGHEIHQNQFTKDEETSGVIIDNDGMRAYIHKLENKFRTSMKYLSDVDYPTKFRQALELQAAALTRAIECADPDIYNPVIIR